MPLCVAFGCSNRAVKDCGVSFHKFPNDEPRRSIWIRNMRRKNFKPTKFSYLCSAHFTLDCMDLTGQTRRLRPSAVPSIFSFPPHMQKVVKKRTTLTSRAAAYVEDTLIKTEVVEKRPPLKSRTATYVKGTLVKSEIPSSSSASKTPFDHDHTYAVMASPRTIRIKLMEAEERAEKFMKQLHVSRIQRSRLERKVEILSVLIDQLRRDQYGLESEPAQFV